MRDETRKRIRLSKCRWIGIVLAVLLRQTAMATTALSADSQMFLKALHLVEAGGRMRPPDGDGGKAIGPFQIHYRYWQDAVRYQPSLRQGGYQKCRDHDYAAQVVLAYLSRFASQAWATGDWEKLARTHNGGPDGWTERATIKYWHRVKACMEKLRGRHPAPATIDALRATLELNSGGSPSAVPVTLLPAIRDPSAKESKSSRP